MELFWTTCTLKVKSLYSQVSPIHRADSSGSTITLLVLRTSIDRVRYLLNTRPFQEYEPVLGPSIDGSKVHILVVRVLDRFSLVCLQGTFIGIRHLV